MKMKNGADLRCATSLSNFRLKTGFSTASTDETLKKIAHELTENLRQNLSVDWSARESVRAKLRLMVKRILRKYKYPPDQQEAAVELILRQAEALGEAWG